MNAFKRFFALILSLCMVLSFVPVSAFATETDGEAVTTSDQATEGQDIFVLGSDNTQGEVKVEHADGVQYVESQKVEDVTGLDDEYVAYDITLYTDEDRTQKYTGEGTVSIPLGDFTSDNDLKGFVVNADGSLTYIYKVTVDTVLNTATFEVPHFSTVGVTPKTDAENGVSEVKDLTVYVGLTKTETISGSVYTNDDVEIEDNSKVTVVVKDTSTTNVTIGDPVDAITPGKYVIYTYLGAYVVNQVDGSGIDLSTSETVWNVEVADSAAGTYYITDGNNNYLTVGNQTAGVTATQTAVKLVSGTSNDGPGQSGFFIQDANGSYNLNNSGGTESAIGKSSATATGSYSRWQFKPYSETIEYSTEVTFTGVEVGQTSVTVGNTLYNVNVIEDRVDVTLLPGEVEVKEYIDNTGNYENNVDKADNFDQVAKLEVSGSDSSEASLSAAVTSLESGKQYVIYNNRAQGVLNNTTYTDTAWGVTFTGLHLNGAADANTTEIWTIEGADGVYTIKDENGQYLNSITSRESSLGDAAQINLAYNTDGYWTISQNGYYLGDESEQGTVAGGWNGDAASTDAGSKWTIYEYIPAKSASTTVTITGVDEGETNVRVGGTRYYITVKLDEVDVKLYPGQVKTFTENDVNHGLSYTGEGLNEGVATVDVQDTRRPSDEAVTVLESGKQYVIVNTRANKPVTNAAASAAAAAGAGSGLSLNGGIDTIEDAAVWTLTKTENGGYTLRDANGKYMTIGSNSAGLSDTAAELTIAYNGSTWTIAQDGAYLNQFGGNSSTCAAGWQDGTAAGDDGSQWAIYEVIPVSTTTTITGVDKGETSVVVGNTRYNITVEKEIVDVALKKGDTQNFVIEEHGYTDDDLYDSQLNTSVATVTISQSYTAGNAVTSLDALEDGKQYIIYNNRARKTMINEDAAGTNSSGNITMYGLKLDGTLSSIADGAVWTLEVVNGVYRIKDANGKYLSIVSNDANLEDTTHDLTLNYTGSAWTIAEGSVYLNDAANAGTNAAGWEGDSAATDAGSMWTIYEAVLNTNVAIYGVDPGTTTVQVGHVTYNITVSNDIKDITVHIGETVVVSQDGVTSNDSNAGQNSAAIADVSWTAMPVGLDVGKLLNTDGSVADTRTLESLEYTFTLNDDGTYSIVDSTRTWYLNVRGVPQSDVNVGAILVMNADGSVNIMGMDANSHRMFLCIYRSGDLVMQWSGGKAAVSENPEGCAFYIYEKVTDPAESSVEIKGYKRITNLDDIQNGEGYLVAFQAEGANYYCVANMNDNVGGKYNNTARIAEPGYADVTITGVTEGKTQVDVDGAIFNITVIPYEVEFSMDVGETAEYQPAVAVTDDEIEAFNNANGQIVTVEKTADGKLKFTAHAVGLVSKARLGGTDYTILVNNEDVDVLSGMGQAQNNVVTQLLLTECVDDYDLNVPDGFTAEWTSGDTNVLTINEEGTITAQNAGTTTVTVEIKDAAGNLVDIKVIPVTVCTGVADTGRWVNIYNEKTVATEPYVYMSCADSSNSCTSLYPLENQKRIYFPEGMHMYGCWHETSQAEILVFSAKPDDGYALTDMTATRSAEHYMPVRNDTGDSYLTHTGCTYFRDGNCAAATAGNNAQNAIHDWLIKSGYQAGIMTLEEVHMVVNNMVRDGMDGAHLFSRSANYNSSYNTTLTFISDKLPEVDKTIMGVQDATNMTKAEGWTEYQDGNYAKVGEYIFYQITVTQEVPQVWQADNANLGALVYTTAMLNDLLPNAYFYTKDLDNLDDKWDAVIPDQYITSEQSVLEELNDVWTAEQKAAGSRTFTFYVAYKIKDTDANQDIVNKVELNTTYHSSYSSGNISSAGSAEATLKVVGASLGDVVLDFGLPIMIPNVTMDYLAHRFDQDASNNAVNGCKYGTVTITQTAGQDTLGLNDDKWTITYTPHEVFTGYDVVYLMDSTGKLMNYFRVYPASTVYYEESFAEFGNAASEQHGWTGHDSAIEGNAQLMFITSNGEFRSITNFGYTKKYADENGKSNGTEAVSTKANDTATFEFTGTGFEVYGNCDPTTSNMFVFVYKVDESTGKETIVKAYGVVTTTKLYDDTLYADSLPLVSMNGLEHGTYKVVVRHQKQLSDDTTPLKLDGFRVFNTMADADVYYPADEQYAEFIELRDEVLGTYDVDPNTTGSQVYSESDKLGSVLYLTVKDEQNTDEGTESDDAVVDGMGPVDETEAENFLNNGPKNEIWLKSDHALAFALGTNVTSAQIGLKAPAGYAKVTIRTIAPTGNATETYEITSATDMFYRIPGAAVSGATVVITVEDGENGETSLLSVTKLKGSIIMDGGRMMPMQEAQITSVLNLLYSVDDGVDDGTTNPDDGVNTDPSDPDDGENTDPSNPDDGENTDPSDPDDGENTDPSDPTGDDLEDSYKDSYNNTVTRIFGENRFETAFKVADELKAVLGVEKFENIIVACGSNFADALSGTYLASVKNAPILLSYTEQYNELVLDYIAENLAEDGTVYILGGNSAVPYTMDLALIAEGVTYKRLAGANRFETNLLILAEAGVEKEEVLVCTGSNFADSLSASATGKPILLVYNESGELTLAQKLYLALLDDCTFTVIGGEKAVCPELEKAVAEYGETKRLAGENRFETSVEIAKTYFENPEAVVLAYAANYPDGLCGGALAYAIEAPLVLTMTGYEADADLYGSDIKAEGGVVLGGSGLIADDSVVDIFDLEKPQEIIVK